MGDFFCFVTDPEVLLENYGRLLVFCDLFIGPITGAIFRRVKHYRKHDRKNDCQSLLLRCPFRTDIYSLVFYKIDAHSSSI